MRPFNLEQSSKVQDHLETHSSFIPSLHTGHKALKSHILLKKGPTLRKESGKSKKKKRKK